MKFVRFVRYVAAQLTVAETHREEHSVRIFARQCMMECPIPHHVFILLTLVHEPNYDDYDFKRTFPDPDENEVARWVGVDQAKKKTDAGFVNLVDLVDICPAVDYTR